MTGVIRKLACLVLLPLMAVAAHAAGITVSQSLDKSDIPFEGTAQFQIVLTWDGPQSAYLFEKPLLPDFERLKVGQYTSSITSVGAGPDEVTTKTYSFTLVPTASGTGNINSVTIEYLTWPDSVAGQLVTEPMPVEIASPIPAVEGNNKPHLLLLILVIGIFVVLAIASWIVRTRVRNRTPGEAVKTPADMLLDNLARLKSDAGGDIKKFQTGLYKQLVLFLKNSYGDDVSGSNADEIASVLQTTGLTESQREKITGWLSRAEREKFTPTAPAPGEVMRLEHEVREYFEKNMMKR